MVDTSITVIYHAMSLTVLYVFSGFLCGDNFKCQSYDEK